MSTGALFMMKCPKQPALVCLIGNIGASARLMAVFSGFYESQEPLLSVNVGGIVSPHRNDHPNSQKSGFMLHHRCVDCYPGGRWGNTERVVA
jgi:hypothetical protein